VEGPLRCRFFPLRCLCVSRRLCCLYFMRHSPSLCDEAHHHPLTEEESARFTFNLLPTCSRDYSTGLSRMHSFQYEQARQAFTDIVGKDPQCAMAHWGASRTITACGATETRRRGHCLARQNRSPQAIRRTTAREKAYIDALAEVIGRRKGSAAHGEALERKMEVQAAFRKTPRLRSSTL